MTKDEIYAIFEYISFTIGLLLCVYFYDWKLALILLIFGFANLSKQA